MGKREKKTSLSKRTKFSKFGRSLCWWFHRMCTPNIFAWNAELNAATRTILDLPQVVLFICAKRVTDERRSREETTCPACMVSNLICILLAGKYGCDVKDHVAWNKQFSNNWIISRWMIGPDIDLTPTVSRVNLSPISQEIVCILCVEAVSNPKLFFLALISHKHVNLKIPVGTKLDKGNCVSPLPSITSVCILISKVISGLRVLRLFSVYLTSCFSVWRLSFLCPCILFGSGLARFGASG